MNILTIKLILKIIMAVLVPLMAFIAINLVRKAGQMGEVRVRLHSAVPKWLGYLFLALGVFRTAEYFTRSPAQRDLLELGYPAFFFVIGLVYMRATRGGRICRNGIDFGMSAFLWSEVRSWNWSADRTHLEMYLGPQAWQFLQNPNKPMRYKTPFTEEANQALEEFCPQPQKATA